MSIAVDRSERHVVPRLRDTRSAVALGEVAPLDVAPHVPVSDRERAILQARLQEWKVAQSIPFASDAIGTAIALGRPQDAADVARFVLDLAGGVPALVSRMARSVLGIEDEPDAEAPTSEAAGLRGGRVSQLRHRLRSYGGNALTWLDLAQAYASNAQNESALKAMHVALGLLPDHRLVLRSAARLFVQVGEHDEALWYLRRSPLTKSDPWLVAAEIAVAEDAGLRSLLATIGRRMAVSDTFPPFHLSELRSAVGTMELGSGGSRRARQLLRSSLDSPSENAVAQAEWVSSMKHISMPLSESVLEASTEALATDRYAKGDWPEAFALGAKWFEEQPFSSQAVMLTSHMAATAGKWYEEVIPMLEFGVRSNSENWCLWNNLAFCQAMDGRLDDAAETLRHAHTLVSSDPAGLAFHAATSGLLAFRRGSIDEGRMLYGAAVDTFTRIPGDQRENRASAAVYWAQEESRLGNRMRTDVLDMADALSSHLARPYLRAIMDRVRASGSNPGGEVRIVY